MREGTIVNDRTQIASAALHFSRRKKKWRRRGWGDDPNRRRVPSLLFPRMRFQATDCSPLVHARDAPPLPRKPGRPILHNRHWPSTKARFCGLPRKREKTEEKALKPTGPWHLCFSFPFYNISVYRPRLACFPVTKCWQKWHVL